jgi:hypothetical protein
MKISMKSKKFSHTLLLPKNEIIKDIEKDSSIINFKFNASNGT